MLSLRSLFLIALSPVIYSPDRLFRGHFSAAAGTSNTNSYGTEFWVPFPDVAVTGVASSYYRVCITNPNYVDIAITMSVVRGSSVSTQTRSLSAGVTRFVEFDNRYMMKGEGIFRKYVRLTSSNNFGVYVMSTKKMDAFTALPVASWGSRYMAVTYYSQSDGPCQIVIVAHEFTKVVVTVPGQDDNTMGVIRPSYRARSMEVSKILTPGDVYQLQRSFDITGAIISSNESVGVLTGSANATIVKGRAAGAFMEFLPPLSTLGMSYVVYKTPPWPNSSDFMRVVALRNGTNVYISTGYQRFQLQGSQYITRKFSQNTLLVEADQPILVVKYSQNGKYPTMTFIPATGLFLLGDTVIISEVPGLTKKQQYLIVVATNDFMEQQNLGPASTLKGTNMAAVVVTLPEGSGNFTLVGPNLPKTSFMVYSYLISDTVSFQTAVAFYQLTLNQPCSVTTSSPGDGTDNDCDGQIDEDICNESNYMSSSDCGPIISGDADIWGQEFTLQVPDHCHGSLTHDIILLYVTARSGGAAVRVTLDTPGDPTKVRKTLTVSRTDNYRIFNLTGAAIKGSGSTLLSGNTLHMTSSAEVSVTLLQVCTAVGSESIMTTRLMPCDVLGREYFAITLCNVDLCQIQIAAIHKGTTEVRIRLRLKDSPTPFVFSSVEYRDGEVISVSLLQYQSLQLQSNEQDMTGTHILASKPVSVFSGGRYTMFKKMHMSNGFVEQLPPVATWGRYFVVQSSPVTKTINKCPSRPCLDYLKIVASTADTVVQVRSTKTTSYTLSVAGDFIEIRLLAVYSTVQSTKPILVLQLTQEVNSIALSGSLVTTGDHYLSTDRVVVPVVGAVSMYLMVSTNHINAPGDAVMLDNTAITLTSSIPLNASFYEHTVIGAEFVRVSSNSTFSGHVYASGNLMAGLFRLAYALTEINPVCVVSKGVPGDNEDNDCDGKIDEEPCDPPGIPTDLDDDGMVNEDCSSLSAPSVVSSSFAPSSTEPDAISTSLSLTETQYSASSDGDSKLSRGSDVSTHLSVPSSYIAPSSSTEPDAVSTSLSLLEAPYITSSGGDTKLSRDNDVLTHLSVSSSHIASLSTTASSASDATSITPLLTPTASVVVVAPSTTATTPESIAPSTTATTPESIAPSTTATTPESIAPSTTATTPESIAPSTTATTPESLSCSVLSDHPWRTTRKKASPATSTSVATNGIACGCHCPSSVYASVLDSSQVAQITLAIQKELYINKDEVSANRRKYISIVDHRPSAQTVGYFGVAIMVASLLGICLLDASALARDIAGLIELCRVQK